MGCLHPQQKVQGCRRAGEPSFPPEREPGAAHGHRILGGRHIIWEALIRPDGRLTGQTDRQISAPRTGWERQPWVEDKPVPAGLLGSLQENKLVALQANLCGCRGVRGADTEPPVCWKPCLEWESQARRAQSNSLPSTFQLCSASILG